MNILFTDGKNTDFAALCKELDDHLNELVGGEKQRRQYVQYNTLEAIQDAVLIYMDDKPVACGGFKHYSEKTAEVKRVFVKNSYRGQGLSKKLMAALEQRAGQKGYTSLILETGAILTAAMGLYTGIGYQIIENYGQYRGMKDSICMQKTLA